MQTDMKVLVTGGGGYIGSLLTSRLIDNNFSVRVLDNLYRGECDSLLSCVPWGTFEFQRGDITKLNDVFDAAEGVDAIVHLAALVGAPICERHPSLARDVNIEGTRQVVMAAKHHKIPVFFASTGSVYGKIDGVCDELSSCNPLSVYGRTKLLAEQQVTSYEQGRAFRFATAYGISPKMRLDLLPNDLAYRAVTEKALVIYQADFRRTFIHAYDMAGVFLYALQNLDKVWPGIYNAGHSSGNMTKREMAEKIRSLTGCAVFYADSGYQDPDQRDYEVNYEKLAATGWAPLISMDRGLTELVKAAPLLQPRNQYV
jgi:nucleoside-diphosphate-sugar epimerase